MEIVDSDWDAARLVMSAAVAMSEEWGNDCFGVESCRNAGPRSKNAGLCPYCRLRQAVQSFPRRLLALKPPAVVLEPTRKGMACRH